MHAHSLLSTQALQANLRLYLAKNVVHPRFGRSLSHLNQPVVPQVSLSLSLSLAELFLLARILARVSTLSATMSITVEPYPKTKS